MTQPTNQYSVDRHVAEFYDLYETEQSDVHLLRRLIGNPRLHILEPFCGTGRLLLPLAEDGHEAVGMDGARFMLDRLREKLAGLPAETRRRVSLVETNVLKADWPTDFDLVVLGGNCFYELATPEEQESCIVKAAQSLRLGGRLFLDNNHMEGPLDESWQRPGKRGTVFPKGVCPDGVRLEGFSELLWFDAARRLSQHRRSIRVTWPDGRVEEKSYVQQKHPPSTAEMAGWLERHGFVVKHLFGDKDGNPYTDASPRAVFWARKA